MYDGSGQLVGLQYQNQTYTFVKNIQGDVTQLRQGSTVVANYTYDAWGKLLSVTDANGAAITNASHIANLNPIRYRSYFYDVQTGFYYLKTRYYNPEWGRFLNADSQLDEGAGLLKGNVYAYCANNPVMYKDDSGQSIIACILIGALVGVVVGEAIGHGVAISKGYDPWQDGWDYWKYVLGFGIAGGVLGATAGALIGWGTGLVVPDSCITDVVNKIISGNSEGYKTFQTLKRHLGPAGDGMEWHHIVEQCQIKKSGFAKEWIHNVDNIIAVSQRAHRAISSYYSSIQKGTGGLRFRDWLAGQSFEVQYRKGLEILKKFRGMY